MDRLRGLDAFPRTLDEFRVKTQSGGVISLVCISLIMLLLAMETIEYWRKQANENVVIDEAMDDMLAIHFDITFPKVSCAAIAMDAVDASGGVQSMEVHSVYKLPLGKDLEALGHVIEQKEGTGTILSQADMQKKHEEHASGENGDDSGNEMYKKKGRCGNCYASTEKCCETCAEVEQAFRERGLEWREDGTDRFWQCHKKGFLWSNKPNPEHHEQGCEVFGSIKVAKSKGSFHFGASKQMTGIDMIQMILGVGTVQYDLSHTIHSLWFGDTPPHEGYDSLQRIDSGRDVKRNSPLERIEQKLPGPAIVQYYIKVVPTDVVFMNGTIIGMTQYSATEHVRGAGRGSLPSVHFFYDTPPLRIQYIEHQKSFSHYISRICALTGGLFSFMSVVDTLIFNKKLSWKGLHKRLSSSI